MSKQTDLINIPDAITVSGSNVGIGTSSPSRQLEIYDDGTVGQAVLALTAQNTEPSRIMFADPDDVNIGILDYHHSDNSMRFIVNNAERMRIDSSGNVVIGANPSTSLGAGDNTAYIGADGEIQIRRAAGTGRNMMKFRNGSNHVGSITTDANKVSLLSLSGDLILDASGIINLDADNGGNINLKDGGTHYGTIQNENSDLRINSIIQDKDIIFRGNDGGTGINALTLDMSNAGKATFNNGINSPSGHVGLGSSSWADDILYLTRSGNGKMQRFFSGTNEVGSIGVTSGSLGVGQGDTGLGFFATDNIVFPSTAEGHSRDNAIDLGYTGSRFRNAYLSGGIYLGGTGSANKLEDYEEGTWTPTLVAVSGGSITFSGSTVGIYTKIGRLVHISFSVDNFSVSGGTGGATINIGGLPFTTQGSGIDSNGSVLGSYNINWSRTDFVALRTYAASTLGFLVSNNNSTWMWENINAFSGSSKYLNGTITYMTTA